MNTEDIKERRAVCRESLLVTRRDARQQQNADSHWEAQPAGDVRRALHAIESDGSPNGWHGGHRPCRRSWRLNRARLNYATVRRTTARAAPLCGRAVSGGSVFQ